MPITNFEFDNDRSMVAWSSNCSIIEIEDVRVGFYDVQEIL